MAPSELNLRRDILRIIGWIIVLPGLAFWPLLSAFPAFALWAQTGSALELCVQALLFLTGFWAVAGAAVVVWFLLSDDAKARRTAGRAEIGLILGCYATIWTILYFIAAFAGR